MAGKPPTPPEGWDSSGLGAPPRLGGAKPAASRASASPPASIVPGLRSDCTPAAPARAGAFGRCACICLRDRVLDLSRPVVMGVLNVTADSFSDGGRFLRSERGARARAGAWRQTGAAIIDVGGESTRPGAAPVALQEELGPRAAGDRGARGANSTCLISVDTRSPKSCARRSPRAPAWSTTCWRCRRPVRSRRWPRARRRGVPDAHAGRAAHHAGRDPRYDDVVAEVVAFLQRARCGPASQRDRRASRIVLDPGFGFGKTAGAQPAAAGGLPRWRRRVYPVLVGLSRKSHAGQADGPAGGRATGGQSGAARHCASCRGRVSSAPTMWRRDRVTRSRVAWAVRNGDA